MSPLVRCLLLLLAVAVPSAPITLAAAQEASRLPAVVVARGLVDVDGGLIQIAASRDGVVREVLTEEGQSVKRDAVLARIDDRIPKVQASVAAAELAQARAAPGERRKREHGKSEQHRRKHHEIDGAPAVMREQLA